MTLRASGAGGLLFSASHATGSIRIHTGSSYNERLRIQASGAVTIGDTYDAGAPSLRVVSSVTLTPLVTVGSDSATSGVAAFFVSNSAARACVLALADGSTYASAIGADGSGNFNYWAGRSPGTAGTSVFSVSTTGVMTANGFGSHLHSAGGTGFNVLEIRNTTAGTGNGAQVKIGNDGSAGLLSLQATSTTYTSTPDRGSLTAIGTGGLDIVSFDANAPVRFLVANAQVMQLHSNGSISMFTGTAPSPGNFHCNGPLIATNVSLNSGTVLPSLISTGFACAVWPTTATAANLVGVNGNVISVSTSLRAIKTDIHSITTEDAISAVLRLRAVHYRSILPNDTDRVWPGFIADEVEDAAPHLAVYRADDGSLQSVAYDRVAAYLVPVAQDHESRLRALEARL